MSECLNLQVQIFERWPGRKKQEQRSRNCWVGIIKSFLLLLWPLLFGTFNCWAFLKQRAFYTSAVFFFIQKRNCQTTLCQKIISLIRIQQVNVSSSVRGSSSKRCCKYKINKAWFDSPLMWKYLFLSIRTGYICFPVWAELYCSQVIKSLKILWFFYLFILWYFLKAGMVTVQSHTI